MLEDKRQNVIIALIISLLLHVILVTLGYFLFDQSPRQAPKEEVVEVDLQSEGGWKIADITPPKEEIKPKHSKHIGIHDSTVKEEMVAAQTPRAPGRPVRRGGKGMEKIKEEFTKSDSEMEMREVIKLSKKEKGSLGTFTKLPEDYYPDYKRGPHTFINVMKHMDAGYFVRLKRVFKLAWDPSGVLRGGMLSGEVSRGRIRVVLGISIDRSGTLSELFVINGSGVKGYDKEALRAVRASAPFSTPPKKFLANDGILRISWSFVVYL